MSNPANQDTPIPPHPQYPPTLGATGLPDGRYRFLVWAPKVERLELKLLDPEVRLLKMTPTQRGYFETIVDDVVPHARYFYRLNGLHDRPDPASRFQPEGVHQASRVVDSHFDWTDSAWSGIPLPRYLTYELHVGTFSTQGTFDAVIPHLDELCDLGVTALELMPVAQFPGGRNWGYDGVHPFAVQNTYGGPQGLKRLVNACHHRGLAVVVDVVYNHLGPEGNYLGEFGHYFTERYRTPWGAALNFDDRHSDEVRRFFIENALYWIDEFHADALRLDAVHAIFDFSARPFLAELADAVRLEGERLNRRVYTIAESDLNDPRLVRARPLGGCGIDAQWCDDFHHALRVTLTDERVGYYEDFRGFDDLIKAYRNGFVVDGRVSEHRARRYGDSSREIAPAQLVVCSQNHDQVGNRLLGERLSELVSFEQLKLAAGIVLLSPYQPLLFMGEEYGERAPFQYFVSHGDPDLVEAVRLGRKEEFASFAWKNEPPAPQDEATFHASKLNHDLKRQRRPRALREFYKRLIWLRTHDPALAFADRERMETHVLKPGSVLAVRRIAKQGEAVMIFHFGASETTVTVPLSAQTWTKEIDSSEKIWAGPGSSLPDQFESAGEVPLELPPHCVAMYRDRIASIG